MKSKLLFNKIVFIFMIIVELILCVIWCVKTNNHKYDEWIETEAKITDLSIIGTNKSFRSNESTVISIMVNYQDNYEFMRFVNYRVKLRKGDTITIRYNPENQRDIIYLPYENHCIVIKRIKIILFSIAVMFFTWHIYEVIQSRERRYEILPDYWYDNNINKKLE